MDYLVHFEQNLEQCSCLEKYIEIEKENNMGLQKMNVGQALPLIDLNIPPSCMMIDIALLCQTNCKTLLLSKNPENLRKFRSEVLY
jgi:hypothetical protein